MAQLVNNDERKLTRIASKPNFKTCKVFIKSLIADQYKNAKSSDIETFVCGPSCPRFKQPSDIPRYGSAKINLLITDTDKF